MPGHPCRHLCDDAAVAVLHAFPVFLPLCSLGPLRHRQKKAGLHHNPPMSLPPQCLLLRFFAALFCPSLLQQQQQQQQQANSSTTTRGTRPLWPVRPTLSLLSRFFAFVDRCATEPHLVSVSEGQVRAIHRRNHGSRGGVPPPPMIEHPTKAGYNVAQCLLPKGWAETAERCRRAHTMLASAMRACNTKNYAAAIAWVLSGDGGEGSETGQVLARDEACPAPKRRRLDPAGAGDPEFLPVNGPSYRECASCGIVHRCPSWMEKRATYCPKCRRSYNDTRSWS
mmetsp:Transcript_113486/g.225884  ORF Transcript_113486/g.225884 Transcript_113486/m.225884 type:complete len:282 (+) Transcript_113486:340-1185(+)